MKYIFFTFVFLFTPSIAHAASFGLSITPPVVQISIKPGTTITQVFTIKNLSESDLTITPQIVPFKPEGYYGEAALLPGNQPDWLSYFSLANSYIHLREPFTLAAGKQDQLVLNIQVPNSAPFSDHYASVLLTSRPLRTETATNTTISGSLAAHLLLTINYLADPATTLQIQNFDLASPYYFKFNGRYIVDSLNPTSFNIKVANLGRYLSDAHAIVTIKTSRSVPINTQSLLPAYVLAGSERILTASPSGTITFHPSLTTIGPHTVNLIIRADNASANSNLSLFYFPLKATIGLIVTIIIIVSLIARTNYLPKPIVDNKKK